MNWTDVTKRYQLYHPAARPGAGSFSPITSPALAGTVHTFHDTTVASGTSYTYEITGADATGSSVATSSVPLTVPGAVSIASTTIVSNSEIDLAWTADSGTVSGYRIYRRRRRHDVQQAGIRSPQRDPQLPGHRARFGQCSRLSNRCFQRDRGAAANSTTGTLTTLTDAPTNFAAAGVSSSEVDLSWDAVDGATGYEVDRQNLDSTWTTLTSSINSSTTSFANTGLAGGTNFTYRVEALDAGGASAPADPESGLTAPDAPTTVTASPISAGEVDLTWDAMTGADSYSVSVSSDDGAHYSSPVTGITDTSYADTTASGGTSYLYQIVATNATGDSDPGTSNSALTVPAAQSDFAATPISTSEIDLSWTDVTGRHQLYHRAARPAPAALARSPRRPSASAITSYQDTTALPGTSYTYEIVGADATGNSIATSSSALTVPAAVGGVTATVNGTSEIDLTWTADPGTVTHYRVMESTGGAFAQVGSDLAANATSDNVTGLTAATAYQFEVLAVNATGASPVATNGFTGSYWSNTQTRPDMLGAPTFQQNDQTIDIGSNSYESTPGEGSVPGAPGGFGTTDWVAEWDGQISRSVQRAVHVLCDER